MTKKEENRSFILKCTRECNFACSYCTDRKQTDSLLPVDAMIGFMKNAIGGSQTQRTAFVFHGGEPLLLGTDYFLKILYLQSLCNASGTITNVIQSNASLITPEWIEFLELHKIRLGISLDGPPESHDKFRRYALGGATSQDVIANIQTLKEAGVLFGILCVASDALIDCGAERVFRFFRDMHVTRVSFLPLRVPQIHFKNQAKASEFYDYRQRYASFMCEIYRLWIEHDDPAFKIRELESKLNTLVGGVPTTCVDNGPCVGRVFGVDSNGTIAHCDKFFHDDDFCFGNLAETTIDDIVRSEKLARAQEIEANARQQCASCDWFSICRGGCLKDAVLFQMTNLGNRTSYCHLKIIYDCISEHLRIVRKTTCY